MELVYQPVAKWYANPNGVLTDKYHLGFKDPGTVPFIYTYNNIVYVGDEQTTHTDIMADLDIDADEVQCEGRVWYGKNIVTFWSFDDYLPDVVFPSSKHLADISKQIEYMFPNFGNYNLIKCEISHGSGVILFTTVDEYKHHNFTGQEDMNSLYRMWEIQEKKKSINKPTSITTSGMATKDF